MQQHIRCTSTKNIPNDTKQMLMTELYRQDREEASKVDILAGRPIDQRLGGSDQYIVLDSSQRDILSSNPSEGLFVFNIVSGGTTGTQMIGLSNQLSDIIEIEMQSFPMPDLPLVQFPINNNNFPILIPNPAPLNFFPIFNNRFIVEIKETSVQSYSDAGGVRHNFAFDLANVNNQLYASPTAPVYVFTDPITRFDTLSLVFRNPPRTLKFSNDILINSRLAIIDPRREAITTDGVTIYGSIPIVIRTNIGLVINIDVSNAPYQTYSYTSPNIQFNVLENNTIFTNVDTGANTFTYDQVNITTSTRILFNGITGAELKANGIYVLTGISEVGVSPNIVYTYSFERTSDMNTPGKCEQYSTVGVTGGSYFGQKFYLTESISDLDVDDQIWKDTNDVYLSIYAPNHEFPDFSTVIYTSPRIKIEKLNSKTLPQKLYNFLSQKDGLYVGKFGVEPDYFRINPDVSMQEFIHNSWTNNYLTKNPNEAKRYGFDSLRSDQYILVPVNKTSGQSQLTTASTYPGWTIAPDDATYGDSTMLDVDYKTFSNTYDTAAVLKREVTENDRYVEFQYTGPSNEDISEMYIGLLPPFSTSDFLTTFVALQNGVVNNLGQVQSNAGWNNGAATWGQLTIDEGVYTPLGNLGNNFNTAVIAHKDMKDGDFIVIQNMNGPLGNYDIIIGTTTQDTYQNDVAGTDPNWTSTMDEWSTNENIVFSTTSTTNLRHCIGQAGGATGTIVNTTIPTLSPVPTESKIYLSAAKVSNTKINVSGTWVSPDGTILYTVNFPFDVTNSDAWFISRRFFVSAKKSNHAIKLIYENSIPASVYSEFTHPTAASAPFVTPYLSNKLPLELTKPEPDSIATINKNIGGYDYKKSPTVQITGGGGSGARAEAIVSNGKISHINLLYDDPTNPAAGSGGTGYTSVPTINLITADNDNGYGATAVATISVAARIEKITLTENTIYITNTNKYDTSCVIDSDIISGNYAAFKYVGNKTQNLNAFVGAVDKNTYPNDLSLDPNFTENEGFLIRINPELPSKEPSQLQIISEVDSWWLSNGYTFGGTKESPIYGSLSGTFNTAAIIKEPFKFGDETGIQYKGQLPRFPSALVGMVDRVSFIEETVESPLILTRELPWSSASQYSFGDTRYGKGIYKTIESKYNTAAGINNDSGELLDPEFRYIGLATQHLKGYYGFINKDSYEQLPLRLAPNSGLTLAKNHWALPAPYKFYSSSDNGFIYKTSTNKYNTASIVERDIRTSPSNFQYCAKKSKHLTSYVGYISKSAYETLSGVADPDNWASDPRITLDEGVLVKTIQPNDSGNYMNVALIDPANADWTLSTQQVYVQGTAYFVDGSYATLTTNYDTAAIINIDTTIGRSEILYTGLVAKTLSSYYGFVNKDSYGNFNYATDVTNWSNSGPLAANGVLFKILDLGDPLNPYSASGNYGLLTITGTSAFSYEITDLNGPIEDINTNAKIILSADQGNVVLSSINDVWNNSDYRNVSNNVVNNKYEGNTAFNSAALINEKIHDTISVDIVMNNDLNNQAQYTPYIGVIDKSSYETLSGVADANNWSIDTSLLVNGVLFKYSSPSDPDNTLGGNSGIIVKTSTGDSIINLGADYGNINSGDRIQSIFTNTSTTSVRLSVICYDKNNNVKWSSIVYTFTGVNFLTWYNNKNIYVTSNLNDWFMTSSSQKINFSLQVLQGNGSALLNQNFARIGSSLLNTDQLRAYITTNDPMEAYKTDMPVSTTIIEYIVNGVKYYKDTNKVIPEINELGWSTLQFSKDDSVVPEQIHLNYLLQQNNGDVLINDIYSIDVSNSNTWYDNKRAYITTKNKSDRYESNAILTNPSNWCSAGGLTLNDGFLFHHVSPDDPSNPYSPNSAIRIINKSEINTIDNGAAIPQINTNGKVKLSYTATSSTVIQITAQIIQHDGTVLYNNTFDIINTDSSKWGTEHVGYISTNNNSEVYTSTDGSTLTDRMDWSDNFDISNNDGILFKILAPNESPNTDPLQAAVQTIVNGSSVSVDVFSGSTEELQTNSTIYIALTKQLIGPGDYGITFTLNIRQKDFTLLATKAEQITGFADEAALDTWLETHRFYVTSSNINESYISKGTDCGTIYFNTNNLDVYTSNILNVNPSDQDSIIVVSSDIEDATHIKVNLTYLDSAKNSLGATQYTFEVADSSTWFNDKRFYISTDNPTEKYTVEQYYPYVLTADQTVNGPTLHVDFNYPNPQHLDSFDPTTYNPSILALNNWTNSVNLTTREGFLINLDFVTGGASAGTSSESGGAFAQLDAASPPAPLAPNTKLNTYDYIQIAINQNVNDIQYEIVVINSSDDTPYCIYQKTMTVANGVTWLADTDKRYYITTNNTNHTFRATRQVHSYKGTDLTPSNGFINVGDNGYENYVTDFTGIIPGNSFIVGPIPDPSLAPPLPIPRLKHPQNFIIALTGQELPSLNGLYQLESLDDIKTSGIRLTRNTLIMPLCLFNVIIPSRQFKIPMRFRRLMRRITNMTGI